MVSSNARTRCLLTSDLPSDDREAVHALVRLLDESQGWQPGALLTRQLEQLEALLAHAAATVPFYRDRLATLMPLKPGSLTLADFTDIPVLRRNDIQNHTAAMQSTALPPGHHPTGNIETSGSTARPITVTTTRLTGLFFSALNLRYHAWFERDFAGTLAVILAQSTERLKKKDPGKAGRWSPFGASGPAHTLDVRTPVRQQLDWLKDTDPQYLLTYPSNLDALLRQAAEDGLRLLSLRQVSTMGEMLNPATRDHLQRVWGVPLSDCYSSQETGIIAIQCPHHGHYHLQAENLFVEIIGDDDKPVPLGGSGRLIITDLHNLAMPLIRYEVGDLAERGPPCECGRPLPVINRILGRQRNMLRLPDGDRMWPSFPADLFTAVAAVRQFQLVQKTLNSIEVRLVVDGTFGPAQEMLLRRSLQERLGHPFDIDFTVVGEISRSKGGKFEDFISDVK